MPWTARHDPSRDIVELVCGGTMTASDLHGATTRCILLSKQKGSIKFLIDAAAIELAASIFDLYDLPSRQYVEEGADRLSRIAVILPTDPKELDSVKFYELACKNRGWRVESFPDRDGALSWLLGEREP